MRCVRLCLAVLAALLCAAPTPRQEPVPPASPVEESPYIGAESCKPCHAAIFEAWSKTSHQRAFRRMSNDDQRNVECLTCHVAGSADRIAAELDQPSHPGVQCECCHGPGRLHASKAALEPPALEGMTRSPDEQVCLRCHNERSPHYRGFFYRAMVGFVHK